MKIRLVLGVALGLGMWPLAGAAQEPAAAPDGQALYRQHCRMCHGMTGVPSQGMQSVYPNLAAFDAAFFARRSDDSLMTVLRNGAGRGMSSFRDKLTRGEMVAVVRYIRSLAGRAP